MKRARIVDTQVADRDITAVGNAERRNKSRKEQFRTIAFDGKIPHAAQIEGDTFQAFVVIGNKLVFLHCLVGTQTEPASRQYEPRSTYFDTMFQCSPYGRYAIGFCSPGSQEIF